MMAWIKAQDGKLVDVATVVIDQVVAPLEVRGDSAYARFTLGQYSTQRVAQTVKDEIETWLRLGANGVFVMPSEAELCGESENLRQARALSKKIYDDINARKKLNRPCSECSRNGMSWCYECSIDTHSHWEKKNCRAIPGDRIEVVTDGMRLTCKVVKVEAAK